MTSTDDSASEDQLGPATAPENFGLTARGFVTEDEARAVGIAVRDCVLLFSRIFDLASLDVNACQEPLLFAGEVAVLVRGRCSRTAPSGLAWF